VPDGVLSGGRDEGVDEAIAAIRAEYAAELPGIVAALAERVAEVAQAAPAAPSPEATARVRAAAHRIRGTAGSYGFHAVGDAAGAVEDALDADLAALADRMRALEAMVRR
jgi:chemotaxis protein histidine kinase CheA